MHVNTAKTFLEIVETGSFFKAAERLHVTQSTISMRINSLEDSLGQKLFIRNRNGVSLTPAGVKFLKYAINMVQTWQQAQQEISLPEGINTYIHIGCEYNFPTEVLINWLSYIQDTSKNIATNFDFFSYRDVSNRIKNGQIDIALTYKPQVSNDTEILPIFEETLVLVSKEKRNLVYWDRDYIYVDYGENFKEQHSMAYPNDETPKMTIQSGDLAMEYILRNGGSCYLRLNSCKSLLDNKYLFLVDGAPEFQRNCYAVYNKEIDNKAWFKDIIGFFEK